jgi:ribosomal protein S27E
MSDLDFNDLFGDDSLDFECPNCSNDFQITINQAGTTVTCPHCNAEIALQKGDAFDTIDNSLNELNETFKNLDGFEF